MKTVKEYIVIIMSLLLYGCSNQIELDAPINPITENYRIAYTSIPDTTTDVTPETAKNVALKFYRTPQSRMDEIGIENVIQINNRVGESIAYAVNYTNNNGFVVVSTSKEYAPILAYSSYGSFSLNNVESSGLSDWIENIHIAQNNIDSIPINVRKAWATEWTLYTSTERIISESRSNSNVNTLIQIATSKWRSMGYNVYTLKNYKQTSAYQALDDFTKQEIEEASYQATTQYGDRDEVCLMLVGSGESSIGYGPLLKTKWGQENGYENINTGRCPAGCVAVAVGQIMKYHQWPEKYSWNAMPNNEPNQIISDFLYDIGKAVSMIYDEHNSIASINNTRTALINNFNYPNSTISDFNYYTIVDNIKNSRPVFIMSTNHTGAVNHAWACDGYYETEKFIGNRLMVLPPGTINLQQQENAFVNAWENGYNLTSKKLYMNWGYEGESNGFYEGTSWTVKGDTYGAPTLIIHNIYPPQSRNSKSNIQQ